MKIPEIKTIVVTEIEIKKGVRVIKAFYKTKIQKKRAFWNNMRVLVWLNTKGQKFILSVTIFPLIKTERSYIEKWLCQKAIFTENIKILEIFYENSYKNDRD